MVNLKNLIDEKDYYNGAVNSYKQKPTDINENLKIKYMIVLLLMFMLMRKEKLY